MRAAIYARYSTELQSERSIDDQVRLCRERAEDLGADVVAVYTDYALTGATLHNRPRLAELLEAARARELDLVIAEALDRLSRDQEDVAGIFKRLSYASVRINTLAEGDVDELHIGLKGTMNALFLRDLAAKIRRGQRGRVEAGFSAGGRCYGYDVVRELDDAGNLVRGRRRINPDQAAVVRRIFAEYAAGSSARAIAASLNRDGIPSPSGREWSASTINGNRRRRHGFLYQDLYAGFLVYNRIRMVRNPETGRRISRPNPPDQWIVVEAPELRIVEPEIWDVCQAIKESRAGARPDLKRRPRRLLSGLVFCGACGGAYTVSGNDRIRCSSARERGTCGNRRTYSMSRLETRILDGLESRLLAPDAVDAFMREYRAEAKRTRADSAARRETLVRLVRDAEARIARLVAAIEDGAAVDQVRDRLTELERNRRELAAELAELETPVVVDLHPDLAEVYRNKIEHLREALNAPETRQEAGGIIRALVDKIVLYPAEGRGNLEIELHGRAAAILALTSGTGPAPDCTVMVVAEEGLEPPTHGL